MKPEERFPIGSRVVMVLKMEFGYERDGFDVGAMGTVMCMGTQSINVGVCWDKKIEGFHALNGKCEMGHGWYVHKDMILRDTGIENLEQIKPTTCFPASKYMGEMWKT